jgi:hypothetical protein
MKTARVLAIVLMLLAVAVSVSATLVTDKGAPFYTTLTEGQAAAAKADQPLLVKFYTDW